MNNAIYESITGPQANIPLLLCCSFIGTLVIIITPTILDKAYNLYTKYDKPDYSTI